MTSDRKTREDLADELVAQLPGLLRYARSLQPDPQQAEDLVQDTLVRAQEKSASFRGESSLGTWLHRILHNLAADASRRRREVTADLTDDDATRVEGLWREGLVHGGLRGGGGAGRDPRTPA